MNLETLRAAYRRRIEADGPDGEACPEPEALVAIIEGRAAEADRLRILGHVGACPRCRADLDLLVSAADAATAVARSRWPGVAPLSAAAGILLLLGAGALWQATRPPAPETLRVLPADAVRLLAPPFEAPAGAPLSLTWALVPSARRYHVEVLDPAGSVVHSAETGDTALAVPAGTLQPGVDYRWWVRAAGPEGVRPSPLRPLRLTAP